MLRWTIIAAPVMLLAAAPGCTSLPAPAGSPQVPRGGEALTWKCLWVWGLPRDTADDAAEEARISRELGFNAICIDRGEAYAKLILPKAHAAGLEVYAVHSPYGEWGFMKAGSVVAPQDCIQEYPPEEIKELENPTSPDLPVHPGPFLCIDRPEVRRHAADLAVELMGCGVNGIALDWVGYRNHRGCQCPYSRAERARFVAAHGELSSEAAETAFSMERMKAYYQAVRNAVMARYPCAKLVCHLYPQFHPGELEVELHGNQLPVEYPAQTVAWFFRPHWPLEQVARRCAIVKSTEHATYPYVTGTGLLGLDMDPKSLKTPHRLRQELQTIKASGLRGLCVAGGAETLADAALMSVLAEQLGGRPTVLRPATRPAR